MSESGSKVGSDLFIIDNTDSEWDVLRYLAGWCRLSKGLDVASAYFEIGSLLALDGQWQQVDAIRILMGDEVTKKTKTVLTQALAGRLDASIEEQKVKDDFLDGVPAIVEAIKIGRIQFRVYRKTKFHAKTYITHSREDVVGSFALVGSSSFTRPGLTSNVELNVQVSGTNVGLLQDWYEHYWEQADDVTAEMLQTIERHVIPFTPFDVWSRSMAELFRHNSPPPDVWAEKHSLIYRLLDGYQRDGYGLLSTAISRASGALTQDDMAANVAGTSPFLKEMLGAFIEAGGRKSGKAQGLDFDELGITDVVELLRNADMEAVLADFDRKNPDEDPVIHFYELFLKEYDAAQKVKRGVFYTPRPVVGFIVRSVDEVLRTEFGLDDGLASTATWGEVIAASKGKEGAEITLPEGAKEGDPFVRILDPATGTGTFLVECVDLIHKTMVAKWKAAGKREAEIKTLWNAYVPAHLLPRLTGFELMMAP